MRKNILSNSKKGSLSLSMNAIVVVVLAFAMLGLGLAVTNMIFNSIDIPEIPKPGQVANAENPIAIAQEIKVKRGSTVNLAFDYYNKNDNQATNAKPIISKCIDENGAFTSQDVGEETQQVVPNYAVLPANVDSGTNHDFVGQFSLKDVTDAFSGGKTYVCSLDIVDATPGTDKLYESKTIYLTVTS